MTTALAQVLISAVELFELEGLRFRLKLRALFQSLVFVLVAGGLLLTGTVWMTWAAFTALSLALSPALAAFIMGCFSLISAGVFLWLSRKP
jgi:hypothetical protein